MKKSCFLLYTLLIIIFGCADPESQTPAHVSFYVGDVTINGESVSVGMNVTAGDTLISGPRSSCDIELGQSKIRLKESSSLTITKNLLEGGKEETDLTLDSGSLLCKPRKLLKDEKFIVRTQTSVAAVRGTLFSVRTDAKQTTRIKVYEGSVKAAPRVKQLDDSPEKLLEYGTTVPANKAVVISAQDAEKANTAVSASLASGSGIDEALRSNRASIQLDDNRVQDFDPSDFSRELDIIDTELEEEEEVEVQPVVRRRRVIPKKLVVSRYEIYKVQQGNIVEKSPIKGAPVTYNNRVYAASANRIYAADAAGKILWEKSASEVEGISREGETLIVRSATGTRRLNLSNGNTVE